MAKDDPKVVSNSIKQNLTEIFTNVADAIRIKEKSAELIPATNFARRISDIETEAEGEEVSYVNQKVRETTFEVTLPTFTFEPNVWYFYDGSSFSVYPSKPSRNILLVNLGTFYIHFATTLVADSYVIHIVCSDDTIIDTITLNNQTPIINNLTQTQLKYEIYQFSLTDVSIYLAGKIVSVVTDQELLIPNTDGINMTVADVLNAKTVNENENLNTILDDILL